MTDIEFGDGALTMMVRRARLIDELRSGRFSQGTGGFLLEPVGRARNRNFVEGQKAGEYCCIGVGASLLGITDKELIDEEESAYTEFCDEYGVTEKTQRYLIGMNDGGFVKWPINDAYGKTYGCNENEPIIRMGKAFGRDFQQIARFLEMIWELTD